VLGGGPRLSTVEVEVYRLAKVTLDIHRGSSLALIQSTLTLLFMLIYSSTEKLKSYEEKMIPATSNPTYRLKADLKSILIIFYFIFVLLLIVAPPLSLILESFKVSRSRTGNTQFSLYWYKQIFFPEGNSIFGKIAFTSIKNSLIFAFSTALLTLPISTLVSWVITRKKLLFPSITELYFLMPLGISSVILGLSYMRISHALPDSLKGSTFLVILAHTVIALPLVFKSILSIFRKVKLSLREAALNLGASSFRTFIDVELPLIKSGLLTGATFAFAVSIGEMNATLMLSQPGTTTLPISIYRLIGSYKFFGACALGTILMFICLLAFLAIDKFDGFGE
jgi:thiamine transport system permease protein